MSLSLLFLQLSLLLCLLLLLLPCPACHWWRFNRINLVKEHAKEHPKRSCKLSDSCSRQVRARRKQAVGCSYALLFTWCYFNSAQSHIHAHTHTHAPNLMSCSSWLVSSHLVPCQANFRHNTQVAGSTCHYFPNIKPPPSDAKWNGFWWNENCMHLICPAYWLQRQRKISISFEPSESGW